MARWVPMAAMEVERVFRPEAISATTDEMQIQKMPEPLPPHDRRLGRAIGFLKKVPSFENFQKESLTDEKRSGDGGQVASTNNMAVGFIHMSGRTFSSQIES